MSELDTWLVQRGPVVAHALDQQREVLCSRLATYLTETFPALGYGPKRSDAIVFQQKTFHETPQQNLKRGWGGP